MHRSRARLAAAAFAALLPVAVLADEPKRPWSDTAEISFIFTQGNSENTNLAASNKLVYNWAEADLTIDAAALRTETTVRVLSNPDGEVEVDEIKRTTAEAYSLAGKYRRTIREGFFWYVGAGWMRNRFAGVDDRYTGGAGIGYRFFKTDVHTLVGEIGADYTDETRVSGDSDSFTGARGFLGYERLLSPTSRFTTELEVLENLDDTDDLRAKSVTALTASVTSNLALKVSYTLFYDRQPVVILVPGDASGVRDALFEFDKTDTVLAASLVINL